LALVLARNGHDVTMAGRDAELLSLLEASRENLRYLPGFILPAGVTFRNTSKPMPETDLLVVAVPSYAVESILNWVNGAPVTVIGSKGLEPKGTGLLTDLIAESCPDTACAVLSGPNLAKELAEGIPTAAVVASDDAEAAETARLAFLSPHFRVYRTHDVKGVELAGALKNVVAICAGASDGLGYGDNTKGALVARGLNEMARLGLAMGAELSTFLGIAGVGDLFATASSRLSRNYRVGYALGQGLSLDEALETLGGQVAEGVRTCEIALHLARTHRVSLPIFDGLQAVLKGRLHVREAVVRLVERTTPEEGLPRPR
jgi:glycerol-3-phosphate dehydrogenase (NAD(P)+)